MERAFMAELDTIKNTIAQITDQEAERSASEQLHLRRSMRDAICLMLKGKDDSQSHMSEAENERTFFFVISLGAMPLVRS